MANAGVLATSGPCFAEYFPKDPPAKSTPIVGLPYSIEAVAVVA